MFDDPFDVLEIPNFLKAFKRSVEEFLHSSILSSVLYQSRFLERVSACAHCRVCAMKHIDWWQNFTFFMQGGQNVRNCHPRFFDIVNT